MERLAFTASLKDSMRLSALFSIKGRNWTELSRGEFSYLMDLKDSMRLSALFCIKGPKGQALRLVGYRHLDNGEHFLILSGSWPRGTSRVTEKEFQYLSLLIGAVNTHGLPKGI